MRHLLWTSLAMQQLLWISLGHATIALNQSWPRDNSFAMPQAITPQHGMASAIVTLRYYERKVYRLWNSRQTLGPKIFSCPPVSQALSFFSTKYILTGKSGCRHIYSFPEKDWYYSSFSTFQLLLWFQEIWGHPASMVRRNSSNSSDVLKSLYVTLLTHM